MITCYVRYVIDPLKRNSFEAYARAWIPIVNSMGGSHHGYFLPDDSKDDVAVALFSFPSTEAFESYRKERKTDARCAAALAIATTSGCIIRYEARLMTPIFPE